MARDGRNIRRGGKAAGRRPAPVSHGAPTAGNISLFGDDNEFAEAVDAGHRVDPRAQKVFVMCVVLVAVYAVALVIPKDMLNEAMANSGYRTGYTFSWFVESLQSNVNGIVAAFTGHDGEAGYSRTMFRYVIIALSGAGLAVCGAVYQGSFRNALVSPSTLGVMSGATLGMMVWAVFLVDDDGANVPWLDSYTGGADTLGYLWSNYSLALVSFVGCIAVVGTVLLVMRIGGKIGRSAIMMIIAGQVIGSVMGAVSNSIRYFYVATNPYGAKAELLTSLQIASFYRTYTWIDIIAVSIPLVATFAVVMYLRRRMNLLSFSTEEARSMGVDTQRMQVVIVALCTLLTAILVSFCGRVGFVGFLVPHLARRLTGPSFSYLLPAATVLGAVFVLGSYILVEVTLGPAFETMSGMFISIAGASVFLVTALRGKGGARGQFQ